MSWASRRRSQYAFGVVIFFVLLVGAPATYWYFSAPPSCSDGKQNQGETSPDRGGPCPLLDERGLSPSATLWARAFRVRNGSYNAVAYVQNSNEQAGVRTVGYRFGLYDEKNVLVAEKSGTTYIMPGRITPVFEGGILTGNRIATHTYFEFLEPLVWERMQDSAGVIQISDRQVSDEATAPRIRARATNTSVHDREAIVFTAVVFDGAGNAFAASQTTLASLSAGASADIVFTWPDPFNITIGRVDITARVAPAAVR